MSTGREQTVTRYNTSAHKKVLGSHHRLQAIRKLFVTGARCIMHDSLMMHVAQTMLGLQEN